MYEHEIKLATDKFESLIRRQLDRVEKIKSTQKFVVISKLDRIIIGVCGGDGIVPIITNESARVLKFLLAKEEADGRIEFRYIEGLTIENRVTVNKAIPDDVLAELKTCHVILKGPTTTPQHGDKWPNIESANVAMRKELLKGAAGNRKTRKPYQRIYTAQTNLQRPVCIIGDGVLRTLRRYIPQNQME